VDADALSELPLREAQRLLSLLDREAKPLRGATIVFDHFHVIKLFNDRLSDLRRGR
jgi:Transposase